jgi:hypothetical protein
MAKTSLPRPEVADPANPSAPWIEPGLTTRLRPLIARGADIRVYSEGFPNAEKFAAVVHASKNTGVPFMVLKDRVLNQRMNLAQAIRSMQPAGDWKLEAQRAELAAKADVFATRPLF